MRLILLFLLLSLSHKVFAFSFIDTIQQDYSAFYTVKNIGILSSSFMLGAIMANTSIDSTLLLKYHENCHNLKYDEFISFFKFFGTWQSIFPIYVLLSPFSFIDNIILKDIGNFAIYSIRAYIVGVPLLLFTQRLFGASRPTEVNGSAWNFFSDDNTVSGHSMMGAIPFLVLANMSSNYYFKLGFYVLSTFPGLSRIKDNKHYFSQVFLGWTLSFITVESLFKEHTKKQYSFIPLIDKNIFGLSFFLVFN